MILPTNQANDGAPWRTAEAGRLAFCTLWTTGPDTTLDGVFRIQVEGADAALDEFCRPYEAGGDLAAATARMVREFGVSSERLTGARHAREAWPELARVLGGAALVPDRQSFLAWWRELAPAEEAEPRVLGLTDLAALLFPGRLASKAGTLFSELCGRTVSPETATPGDLRRAAAELVRRFLALDEGALALAAKGYARAWETLRETDPEAGRVLGLVLSLVDDPGAWARGGEGELAFEGELPRGRVSAAARSSAAPEDVVEELLPRCVHELEDLGERGPLPTDLEEPTPFVQEDRKRLDDVFEAHLPALFQEYAQKAGAATRATYRAGQHLVAREVAGALGGDELALVHAPTGTGKTLAYLVPAILWAVRHEVRVGVATYTRALQEQAMDQEVPRALAALARAGLPTTPRVSVLKGRENYVCWRALKLAVPEPYADGATWLAWTQLALFTLIDPDGDLDRLPRGRPLPLESTREYRRQLETLVRHARAQTSCCRHVADRRTCAAEVARRRAERSHVVLTNHSFALFRQEFFKRMVFDECEHLHDQAHNAWSHKVSVRYAADLLRRIHQPGVPRSRAPLDRLFDRAMPGTKGHDLALEAANAWKATSLGLALLEQEAETFEVWRREVARTRNERETHSLLREYCEEERGEALVEARRALTAAGARLESTLAELAELLDTLPGRGTPRLRRGLELVRTDLVELLAVLDAWIPLNEGAVRFRRETFYDVERDGRDDLVLAARVLLPNEYLARHYYPKLSTGVFLSATTWLRGGFEASKGYLGLDRVRYADEDEDDEDEPLEHEGGGVPVPRAPTALRPVATFRCPEVFDYSRVQVAVPRDAPPPSRKDEFLKYVRRFVAHLGERTRGRMLVLFTNAEDTKRVGRELSSFFHGRRIPFWYQNMEGVAKEELGDLFRSRRDSILLGVDTFWYGADFPGETLEYLVIVRLPYGVPDRYHHAQCAALGTGAQRNRIYMPRSLAKFRQGFGRLMRKESDRGCVYVLDSRILDPRHRLFLEELPLADAFQEDGDGARLVRGETTHCLRETLAHMDMLADIKRRELDLAFEDPAQRTPPSVLEPAPPYNRGDDSAARVEPSGPLFADVEDAAPFAPPARRRPRREPPEHLDVPPEELPF